MSVMSVPLIRFRPLAESDLPTLVKWFAEPEIARWWNQPAEIDSVRAKYPPRIEQHEPTQMWIAEISGEDGGLLQSYLPVDYPEHDECVGIAEAVGIEASWRALEHAGFARVGECQPPDEPRAYVYVRERRRPIDHKRDVIAVRVRVLR